MFGAGMIGPGGALLAVLMLIVWIVILIWLSERVLRFLGIRTAWRPLDPRSLVSTFALLTGAIHLGNYALDLLDSAFRTPSYPVSLGFPSAFLIGSVAIGVGIAGVRWHRKQKRK